MITIEPLIIGGLIISHAFWRWQRSLRDTVDRFESAISPSDASCDDTRTNFRFSEWAYRDSVQYCSGSAMMVKTCNISQSLAILLLFISLLCPGISIISALSWVFQTLHHRRFNGIIIIRNIIVNRRISKSTKSSFEVIAGCSVVSLI